MEHDLEMRPFDLNIALTVFYICVSPLISPRCFFCPFTRVHRPRFIFKYTSADIPSNLALKHFGSVWLAFLVIGFGIVTLLSAFIRDMTGLLVNRAFLGLCEGGTLVC